MDGCVCIRIAKRVVVTLFSTGDLADSGTANGVTMSAANTPTSFRESLIPRLGSTD